MKRFLLAGLLALGWVAVQQQDASAWHKFNFGAGFHLSYETSGCCWNWGFHSSPVGCYSGQCAAPAPMPYQAPAYYPEVAYGHHAPAIEHAAPVQQAPVHAAPAHSAPAHEAPAPAPKGGHGLGAPHSGPAVGYAYYGGYGYGNAVSYHYAPSYWYE